MIVDSIGSIHTTTFFSATSFGEGLLTRCQPQGDHGNIKCEMLSQANHHQLLLQRASRTMHLIHYMCIVCAMTDNVVEHPPVNAFLL
jgi:hypothetical protein